MCDIDLVYLSGSWIIDQIITNVSLNKWNIMLFPSNIFDTTCLNCNLHVKNYKWNDKCVVVLNNHCVICSNCEERYSVYKKSISKLVENILKDALPADVIAIVISYVFV